jgi:ribosomal-protein-alanine N-acetyltransferase
MLLETPRLLLRPPVVEDAQEYLEFCNSEFVMLYNAMKPRTLDAVQRQFAEERADETLILEHKQTGKMIGVVCIEQDSLRYDVASRELSYFLREEFSCQGYMTEALARVIDYLFRDLKLDYITARSFAPNIASRRLLEGLGFQQVGLIPHCVRGYGGIIYDDAIYSIGSTN